MKKALLCTILIVALFALTLTGCGLVTPPVTEANAAGVFTLDVNPGMRVYVDEDNNVIKLEATNEDGTAVVSEITYKNEDVEVVVEKIIDKLDEKGFIAEDETSVLITVEKWEDEFDAAINAKIDAAMKKHDKVASIIEQRINEIDKEVKEELDKLSEKYDISRGKARLIEKIREEFPELSEAELAELSIHDLRMMLEETSEDVKKCFHKIGDMFEDYYEGKEAALACALGSLEITLDDVRFARVRLTRDDGKMVYEVKFVYGENEYEIEIDAESGEILETESEPYEEFDLKGAIKDFCDKHGFGSMGNIFDSIVGSGIFDKLEGVKDEVLKKRGEIIEKVMAAIELLPEKIKKTEIELHKDGDNAVYEVEIETVEGDEYELVVEASTGVVIRAELNDEPITITVEKAA